LSDIPQVILVAGVVCDRVPAGNKTRMASAASRIGRLTRRLPLDADTSGRQQECPPSPGNAE